MNRRRSYTNHFLIMALLSAVAIGVVNYLSMEYRTRIDLTADKRFTLSEGTKRLFERLPEPVSVTYYVDEELPSRRVNLERDVLDKLEEIERASGGKFHYRIDRITNVDRSVRREELERIGVHDTVEVLTAGADEAAEARGVQGYFSSLEVRYGTAEPTVINGIVNLVDRADETREHRVDTLEFDIVYSVLRMQHHTERPSFERLMRAQTEPVVVRFMRTRGLSTAHREMADNVNRAMEQITALAPDRIDYEQVILEDATTYVHTDPFGSGDVVEVPFFDATSVFRTTPEGETLLIPQFYIAALAIRIGDQRPSVIRDFREHTAVTAARNLIEDRIWEHARPRTRLGVVLPPAIPQQQQRRPGDPPQTDHTDLFLYLRNYLEYDVVWVDLKGDREIPSGLACLLLLEPNKLSEREIYEIDRYLAEGGNVAMFPQSWGANLDFTMARGREHVPLTRQDMMPHFKEWTAHLGIEFGQELLLHENAILSPFVRQRDPNTGRWFAVQIPSRIKLAPKVQSAGLNTDSILTRGITGMPLPLPVELKLDNDRVSELGLEASEVIRLTGDVYRFLPSNPRFPEVPLDLDLALGRNIEMDPNAEPDDTVRAQRMGHEPLIAVQMRGRFPSLWADQELSVPGWDGDDPSEEAAPPVTSAEGTLIVFSTAGMLNTSVFGGYQNRDIGPVVVDTGVALYRNITEGFVYGEDIVGLRTRTGTAPRIQGPVTQDIKVFWFLVTVLGMPFALMVLALGRMYVGIRERADYEEKLAKAGAGKSGQSTSDHGGGQDE
jgi:hypothetical protein